MDQQYVIVRTHLAGVHAGVLKSRNGKEATLTGARRLWYWKGAASLSELSQRGVKEPKACKFPMAVAEILLLEVIEIIPCTDVARKSIEGVPEWHA